ncbi:Pectinesterase [Macleaya cordata]|uniref:Pectinesterase n=1 Tax=Macleaya cordata TaxID=56857 RepID=A0A200PVC5_MACCD|nr:Pectinesterase [Macleaya cordata]
MASSPSFFITLIILSFLSFCSVHNALVSSFDDDGFSGHQSSGCSSSSSSVVPSSTEFLTSVRSSIEQIRDVTSLVSKYLNGFDDFRLTNAINDCVDLLDFSADELSWTASATENLNGKDNSTGNRKSDLKAWLSAALGNQETCIDGFEGTDSFIKDIIGTSLQQVTSLVKNVLGMVCDQVPSPSSSPAKPSPGHPSRKLMRADVTNFPSWMKAADRRLLQASASGVSANAVVAADGSGTHTSVMDAVLASPDHGTSRYVIYVKRGVYKENVEIKKKKWNLMMIGDGMGATVISGNRNFVDGWTTFRSATFAVAGRGFIARDITFENTAGPEKHQAVALRSDSDLSAFFRCGIHGYQDTLYAHSLRQFYRECQITGTVDFIFGNGAVILQNCQILAKKGLPNQKNTITAQGRKDPNQNTGFSIQFSNISADSDLLALGNSTQTYLGRPWKQYSRTVFMKSYMSSMIRPEGWLEWQGDFALDTLYYGEYMNYGPGAGLDSRVKWPGYHPIYNSTQANYFSVAQFLDGNLWLPSTGVKYTAGLEI